MSAHDELKKAGIVPTTDAEKAYRLGQRAAQAELQEAQERLERFGRALVEIHLITQRTR